MVIFDKQTNLAGWLNRNKMNNDNYTTEQLKKLNKAKSLGIYLTSRICKGFLCIDYNNLGMYFRKVINPQGQTKRVIHYENEDFSKITVVQDF